MQLRIIRSSSSRLSGETHYTIGSFSDFDALGRDIARDVKTWAKGVPLRKQGSRLTLHLDASWTERETKKKKG